MYYEAPGVILRIEYKFCRAMPKTYRLTKDLSALQARWLDRNYDNGHNCAVVTGFGASDVVVFIDGAWRNDYTRDEMQPHIVSRIGFIESLNAFMFGKDKVLGEVR